MLRTALCSQKSTVIAQLSLRYTGTELQHEVVFLGVGRHRRNGAGSRRLWQGREGIARD